MCIAFPIIGTCSHELGTRLVYCFPNPQARSLYCLGTINNPTPDFSSSECEDCADIRKEAEILQWCEGLVERSDSIKSNGNKSFFLDTPPDTAPITQDSGEESSYNGTWESEEAIEDQEEEDYEVEDEEIQNRCQIQHMFEIFIFFVMVTCLLVLIFLRLN